MAVAVKERTNDARPLLPVIFRRRFCLVRNSFIKMAFVISLFMCFSFNSALINAQDVIVRSQSKEEEKKKQEQEKKRLEQEKKQQELEKKEKERQEEEKQKQEEKERRDVKNGKFTAEQIVEGVIYTTGGLGGREALKQVRAKGLENGKFKRSGSNGNQEEFSYQRSFIRGDNMEKDRIRVDQKSPTIEYSLIFNDGNVWGEIDKSSFTPRQEISRAFSQQFWRSIDALLRYKENGSTVKLVGKEKKMGVDYYVLELTDKDNRNTRYYISSKLLRVAWLEYEEPLTLGGTPVKFMRRFYDYRVVQGTSVPHRTVFYENGQQVEELNIQTVTYGVKVDDYLFDNPNLSKKP